MSFMSLTQLYQKKDLLVGNIAIPRVNVYYISNIAKLIVNVYYVTYTATEKLQMFAANNF